MPSVTIGALTFIYSDDLLGLTQEINVDASVDFLDGQALINAIRQAEVSTVGMAFPQIALASGKAQLSSGVFVGTTIQLLDNWRIYTLKDSGTFAIGGANIVKSDGSTIFVSNPAVTYIQNLAVASTQVSTSGGSGSGLTKQEVRDAFALATAVTPAAGSIDSKISAIPTTDNTTPIAAIKTQTDKLVFTTAGRVDSTAIGVPTNTVLTSDSRLNFLDASITANSPSNVWSYTTRTLTSAGSTLTAADVWNYTTRSLTTSFPTVPTANQNAAAVRTELSIELGKIDQSVSSVFTSGDRALLSAIPTNTYTSALSTIQSSVNALPTLATIEGSIVLFKSSNYTAPDNAGIASLNSKVSTTRADGLDRLPNLDALITSRATPDQVWSVPYSGLTQTGTIGRMLYWIGKLFGVTSTSVTASNDARTTGDGTINQTITTNPDGSKTMSGNP